MKKSFRGFLVIVLLVWMVSMFGCGKEKGVDPSVRPEMFFSLYDDLTQHYGTVGRTDTLKVLNIDLQQVNIENPDHLGLPLKDTYAGLEFDVYICFSGKDDHFSGVEYQLVYQYPEEKEKLLADILTLSKQMTEDFGPATDTSYVFNWAEKKLHEQWNRDIAYWQDPAVLDRLLEEEFSGELLWWNLTPVATESILKELETYGDKDATHGLLLDLMVSEYNGTVTISIWY